MARGSRVVFHETLKAVRDRFGRDIQLEGLATARRSDVPVKPFHHVMAALVLSALGILAATAAAFAMVGLNGLLTRPKGSHGRRSPALHRRQWPGRAVPVRIGRIAARLLARGDCPLAGRAGCHDLRRADQLGAAALRPPGAALRPPFTKRPFALYIRREQKTDAPGPLDLSVAAEAKFIRAFLRLGPTVCVGTNHVPAEDPPGTARIRIKDDDTAWTRLVETLGDDATFTAIDVTDPTARALAQVRSLALQSDGPRFGLLIALGTPERRMKSWVAVADAIRETPARVSAVAPKAPPCVMLIDGSIWTAVGQAPHALGAAQLSVALSDGATQSLFDVASGRL